MAACARLSLPSPSRLAFDQPRAEGPWRTLYGLPGVPCDTRRRAIRAPLSPEALRPLCKRVWRPWQRGRARAPLAWLEADDRVALAGTGEFSATALPGASWRHTGHRHGSGTESPQMVGAALLPPDVRAVMPWRPAPIVQQAGAATKAGERQATQRLVGQVRQAPPPLKGSIPAESRSANAPHSETRHAAALPSRLGVKEGAQTLWCQQVQAAEQAGRGPDDERHDRAAGLGPRWRFGKEVPLHASHAAVRVHCLAYGDMGAAKVQPCRGVTDWRVSRRHGWHRMRGGRARWQREHATCHTLTQQGSHFEHHAGHGTQQLAVGFAGGMRRAFVVDQTQPLGCALCRAGWTQLGRQRLLWERLRAWFSAYRLESLRALFDALFYGVEKPRPLLTRATS
jgi:hypothetical protein